MIVDERLVTYINSLDRGNSEILDEIEKEALDTYVPIIRKEMQTFLKLLLAMQKPMRILEVGTAVGFSAVLGVSRALLLGRPVVPVTRVVAGSSI